MKKKINTFLPLVLLLIGTGCAVGNLGGTSAPFLRTNETFMSSDMIIGELGPVTDLLPGTGVDFLRNDLEEDLPFCVRNENKVTFLLADPTLFHPLFRDSPVTVKVRVFGIRHDRGLSITPIRVEFYNGLWWDVMDLPASGISGRGAMGGDE